MGAAVTLGARALPLADAGLAVAHAAAGWAHPVTLRETVDRMERVAVPETGPTVLLRAPVGGYVAAAHGCGEGLGELALVARDEKVLPCSCDEDAARGREGDAVAVCLWGMRLSREAVFRSLSASNSRTSSFLVCRKCSNHCAEWRETTDAVDAQALDVVAACALEDAAETVHGRTRTEVALAARVVATEDWCAAL